MKGKAVPDELGRRLRGRSARTCRASGAQRRFRSPWPRPRAPVESALECRRQARQSKCIINKHKCYETEMCIAPGSSFSLWLVVMKKMRPSCAATPSIAFSSPEKDTPVFLFSPRPPPPTFPFNTERLGTQREHTRKLAVVCRKCQQVAFTGLEGAYRQKALRKCHLQNNA